ncbi:ADP-dependent glucokinase/phosphofructokinase [Arthrobacter sp. AB6]|uniref:ADP-dependent glucokinase/phosphofructokinase n=1 Tax=Arthrobacter sp. AB6 TaxID=2962570 RepID=UPI002881BBDB|nr:ADP-dependent glucokinase/phosphofructokinase [Arthrobacter sp. AB6]MDT0196734.1 ADP-dependent glucokinase/phosphofructokinase [Arthrobacter sp. AB6]
MSEHSQNEWLERYTALGAELATKGRESRPLAAGFTAFVDALYKLGDASLERLRTTDTSLLAPAAATGIQEIQKRLREGRDGEIVIDDPNAGAVLESIFGAPAHLRGGGTAVHACASWAQLGRQPLLALSERNTDQLHVLHPAARIAEQGQLRTPKEVTAGAASATRNHILEFTKGMRYGETELPRSSRISVRLGPKGLQQDPDFAAESILLGAHGAVGLVSGLNGLPNEDTQGLAWVTKLVSGWKESGFSFVHCELAEFENREQARRILDAITPEVDSIGMSADELNFLTRTGASPTENAATIAEAMNLKRVVVHGDKLAFSIHRLDPVLQQTAMMAGCLAAANKASTGVPQADLTVPPGAVFASAEADQLQQPHGWRLSAAVSPYLEKPSSTIGLGDTFVSGDLFVQSSLS